MTRSQLTRTKTEFARKYVSHFLAQKTQQAEFVLIKNIAVMDVLVHIINKAAVGVVWRLLMFVAIGRVLCVCARS